MRFGPAWRRSLATVAVVGVVGSGLVAFATLGELSVRPTSADPGVARLLDLTSLWGTRTRTTPEGTDWITSAAQVGTRVDVGPSTTRTFRTALDDLLEEERAAAFEDSRVVRMQQVTRAADGTTTAEVAVEAATPSGLFLLGFEGTGRPDVRIDPPIRLLSADAEPGDRWSGKGTWDDLPYEHRASIRRLASVATVAGRRHDCIEVRSRFRLGADERVTSREVLCPGLGSVREAFGDTRVEQVSAPGVPAARVVPASGSSTGPVRLPTGPTSGWGLEPVAQLTDQYGSRPTAPPVVVGSEDEPLVIGADVRSRTLRAFAPDTGGAPTWWLGLGAAPRGRIGVDERDGTTYVGTPDRRVYAATRQGLLRWVAVTDDNVAAAPVRVADRVVVAGEDGRIRALDHGTGERRWDVDLGTPSVADPLALDADVVVADDAGVVRRLRGRDGSEVWARALGSPVVDALRRAPDGDLLVSSVDGTLRRLDGTTGEPTWTVDGPGQAVGGPVVSGGLVVVVDPLGRVSGHDLEDGSPRYRRDLGAVGPAAPVAHGIVVGRQQGGLVALDDDGETVGTWSTSDAQPARLGVPAPILGATYGPAVGAGALWFVDDAATLWRLGPPRPVPTLGRTWVHHVSELREEPSVQAAVADGRGGVLVVHPSATARLDPGNGAEQPLAPLPDDLGPVEAATVIEDVLVLTTDDELVGLDARDGALRWRVDHGPTSNTAPTAYGSTVALRTAGPASELLLVSWEDGTVVGRVPTGDGGAGAQPIVCGGTLVVPSGGDDLILLDPSGASTFASGFPPDVRTLGCDEDRGRIWVVGNDGDRSLATWAELATGDVLGTTGLGPKDVAPWDRVEVVGTTVVVPTLFDGTLGLDADTGALRWTRPTRLLRGLRPTVVDGRVWTVDRTGALEVLDPATGAVVATERGFAEDLSSTSLLGAPFAVGEHVVLASRDLVWALPREVGA